MMEINNEELYERVIRVKIKKTISENCPIKAHVFLPYLSEKTPLGISKISWLN